MNELKNKLREILRDHPFCNNRYDLWEPFRTYQDLAFRLKLTLIPS